MEAAPIFVSSSHHSAALAGENKEAFNFGERHRQEILGSDYSPVPF
jgi:hypothetical protein